MPHALRAFAAQVLEAVRRWPLLHALVHRVAVLLVKMEWGEQFVGSILGPDSMTIAEYRAWIAEHDTLSAADRVAIAAHIARMRRRPLISVVMPVYAPPPRQLRAAIESVRAQLYPNWELCIADDASPSDKVWRILTAYAAADPRIKLVRRTVNGHISAATNSALELATGEFIALIDHDDLLAEGALYHVAAVIERNPDADLIYSDEDKIDHRGLRSQPYFKTDWNPELLLGHNLVSHLGVYRRSLVMELGGLRQGFEGSQDHDLALRVSERTRPERIHHIPWVLYHWRHRGRVSSFSRRSAERCVEAARQAVEEHLHRTGDPGATVATPPSASSGLRVRRPLPDPRPLVSIIVPTRDRADLLDRCIDGVLHRTAYAPLELLIIDNDSVEPDTHALFDALREDPRVRLLPAPGRFNYSALMNQGVAASRGDIVLQLNNDIEVIHDDWLDELVVHAVRPNVGAVGARLLYPDGRVQHAGVVLGVGSPLPVAGHLHQGAARGFSGVNGHLTMTRNVSAVTGACMALRRSVYDEVGGMDAEHLAVAFNDVDLCLKIRAQGYDIVWTPWAELYHHESASRGEDVDPVARARFEAEIRVMRDRWGPVLDNDPFYGPNFSRDRTDYGLASPPRRAPPWLSSDNPR